MRSRGEVGSTCGAIVTAMWTLSFKSHGLECEEIWLLEGCNNENMDGLLVVLGYAKASLEICKWR